MILVLYEHALKKNNIKHIFGSTSVCRHDRMIVGRHATRTKIMLKRRTRGGGRNGQMQPPLVAALVVCKGKESTLEEKSSSFIYPNNRN